MRKVKTGAGSEKEDALPERSWVRERGWVYRRGKDKTRKEATEASIVRERGGGGKYRARKKNKERRL